MYPLRIAHLGDIHLGINGREAQVELSLDFILEDLRRLRPNLVVQAGDVFDGKSTIADRNLLARWLQEVSEVAPVYAIKGNHDAVGDLQVFGRLRGVSVWEEPELVVVHGVLFMMLPHVAKGALVTDGDMAESSRASEAQIREMLSGDWAAEARRHQGPVVLVSHCDVRGRVLSAGESRPDQAIAMTVSDLLASGADAVMLGHIHQQQALDPRVWYAGSIARANWGERVEDKGYLLWTIQGKGELPIVERRLIPTRPMVSITRTLDEASGTWSQTDGPDPVPDGAEVRVRLVAPEARMAELALERGEVLARWPDARVEAKTIAQASVRSEAIGRAETETEMLGCYWQHESVETPSEEFQGRALAALAELVEEVGA